jgi:DNA-directed RNA polymerase I subunit RPA12
MSSSSNPVFTTDVNFCPSCGTLLPSLPARGNVICRACKHEITIASFASVKTSYDVVFNKRENFLKKEEIGEVDGPVVERRCPECNHDRMSYAALQLRSADEGQTVFFTCLKCKYKESENS